MEEKIRKTQEEVNRATLYRTANLGPHCTDTRWRGSAYTWVAIRGWTCSHSQWGNIVVCVPWRIISNMLHINKTNTSLTFTWKPTSFHTASLSSVTSKLQFGLIVFFLTYQPTFLLAPRSYNHKRPHGEGKRNAGDKSLKISDCTMLKTFWRGPGWPIRLFVSTPSWLHIRAIHPNCRSHMLNSTILKSQIFSRPSMVLFKAYYFQSSL